MREFILSAAVYINDKVKHDQQPKNIDIGYVVCGRRHNNCFQTISSLKGDLNTYLKSLNLTDKDYNSMSGFITSSDKFVDRKEAYKIALINNQIKFPTSNNTEKVLISEHLY